MRFLDDNIKLLITDKAKKNTYKFKAYLERSDVQVKVLDTNLQYAPISYTNNTQFLKVQYNVDFSFNVFSEYREEAIDNYDKLHDLFASVKPNYRYINNQLLPNSENIFGLLSVSFRGLPRLSKANSELDIYITNFAYNINKDMGYIQIPYDPFIKNDSDRNLLYKNNEKSSLVPIAYKIDLSGRVLLPIEEAANVPGYTKVQSTKNEKAQTDVVSSTVGGDQKYQDEIFNMMKNIVGQDAFSNLPESKQRDVLKKIKSAKDSFILDPNGNPSKRGKDGKQYAISSGGGDNINDQFTINEEAKNAISSIKQSAGIK